MLPVPIPPTGGQSARWRRNHSPADPRTVLPTASAIAKNRQSNSPIRRREKRHFDSNRQGKPRNLTLKSNARCRRPKSGDNRILVHGTGAHKRTNRDVTSFRSDPMFRSLAIPCSALAVLSSSTFCCSRLARRSLCGSWGRYGGWHGGYGGWHGGYGGWHGGYGGMARWPTEATAMAVPAYGVGYGYAAVPFPTAIRSTATPIRHTHIRHLDMGTRLMVTLRCNPTPYYGVKIPRQAQQLVELRARQSAALWGARRQATMGLGGNSAAIWEAFLEPWLVAL